MQRTIRLARRSRKKVYKGPAAEDTEQASLQSESKEKMKIPDGPSPASTPSLEPELGAVSPDPELESSIDGDEQPLESLGDGATHSLPETLEDAQRMLEKERNRRKAAEETLAQKEAQLKKFHKVHSQRMKEMNKQLEAMRTDCQTTAGELNKLKTLGQGFYQVTDQYLADLIVQLRYLIRDFAIQYFGDGPPTALKGRKTPYWDEYVRGKHASDKEHDRYIRSAESQSRLVQAFLWKVLIGEVFGDFHWAGRHVARLLRPLWTFLQPNEYLPLDSDYRARQVPGYERKFQMWSARTTAAILDTVDFRDDSPAANQIRRRKGQVVRSVTSTIGSWSRSDSRGFCEQLHVILDAAYNLDREICRQLSRINWVFDCGVSEDDSFDPSTMQLEAGQQRPTEQQKVRFVIAPAVIKRGRATGEDFQTETMLLKLVVSCK